MSLGLTPAATIKKALGKPITALDHCRNVTRNGRQVAQHLGRTNLPSFDKQSVAHLSPSRGGVNTGMDIRWARVGKVIAAVVEVAMGPADVTQFQGFVAESLVKVK